VADGGAFTAEDGPESGTMGVVRSYTYQDTQFYLTSASGPWGDLSWTYDGIGNRLTETRDGNTDSYVYTTNGSGGNTPVLDRIDLWTLGSREYTWGAAGHLEEVGTGGANPVDFAWDQTGRLASADRTAAGQTASFLYDGRSFLLRAGQAAGGTALVTPVYDSSGLLHVLERQASPSDPIERTFHLYLAGRPVAQLAIDGLGTETWTYLTADHLGTPLLATDSLAAVVWEGGFEPFGTDYQEGMAGGALQNGIALRLPGQWDDDTWADATSGAGLYYNVHRWYARGTSAYTRPDPLDVDPATSALYALARSNPLGGTDPLGLFRLEGGAPDCLVEYLMNRVPDLISHPTIPGNLSAVTGAAPQEIPIALAWGSGPKVVLTDIPEPPGDAEFGEFDPSHPDEVHIQRRLVDQLCNCPCDEAVVGLGITLLHELAHQLYYNYRGLEGKTIEAGRDFTDRTYEPDTYTLSIGKFYFGCH